jgi:elongation factor P
MIQATQLKRGMVIKHDGDLFRVVEAQHKTPGNLRGMVQAKIRNLKTGSISDHRFRSVDMVERAILDDTEMEFLYQDGDMYHFMNNETFEQIGLSGEVLGDAVSYLVPNIKLKVEMYEERPVGIELPLSVVLKVVETEPAIKGATVSNQNKPAKMETGLIVNVPPFISEGDDIRVDTASGLRRAPSRNAVRRRRC